MTYNSSGWHGRCGNAYFIMSSAPPKSPNVDDRSCLTVYRPHSLAAVSLQKFVQAHVDDRVVGIDVRGDCHPRSADILKLKNRCSHGSLRSCCSHRRWRQLWGISYSRPPRSLNRLRVSAVSTVETVLFGTRHTHSGHQ
jgi:hypothetical protein